MASSKDKKKPATCIQCGEAGLYIIPTEKDVYIECKGGHAWREQYIDQGGTYPRPKTIVKRLEDMFSPPEKELYLRISAELESNSAYYKEADTWEKINRLCEQCNANEQEIYTIFKIITLYHKAKGGL
ncbi:MAG: hypothetical protein GX893_04490 [Firmicutes bacterium]|nr:hypothetical protein [Bacillota bacterium]